MFKYLNTIKNMENNTIYQKSLDKLLNSIIWTHKINATNLDKLEKRRKILAIIKFTLIGVSTILTTAFAILNWPGFTIGFSLFSVAATIFGEILDKIETKDNVDKLRQSKSKLWMLKEDIDILQSEIDYGKITEECIKVKLENYIKEFTFIQEDIPSCSNKVVEEASFKLKQRKDEEIDFKSKEE